MKGKNTRGIHQILVLYRRRKPTLMNEQQERKAQRKRILGMAPSREVITKRKKKYKKNKNIFSVTDLDMKGFSTLVQQKVLTMGSAVTPTMSMIKIPVSD